MLWFLGKIKEEDPKKKVRQETCDYCGGNGKVSCSECGGTGKTGGLAYHFTCISCDGSGEVYCPVCSGLGYTEKED